MTKKWFSETCNPPRIPIFYTLTKIHKPNPVGRLTILGCEGPTERLSSFVDKLLQLIAQTQKLYLKDTAHVINFIERTKVSQDTILVSMDVTSLYTNTLQEESQQYAKHAKNITTTTLPSHPTISKKCFALSFKKIHSNLLDKLSPNPWNRNGYEIGSCIC